MKWCIGDNLFSSWRYQTEDEQRAIYDKIGAGSLREITCPEAHSHPFVQQCQRDLEMELVSSVGQRAANEEDTANDELGLPL